MRRVLSAKTAGYVHLSAETLAGVRGGQVGGGPVVVGLRAPTAAAARPVACLRTSSGTAVPWACASRPLRSAFLAIYLGSTPSIR